MATTTDPTTEWKTIRSKRKPRRSNRTSPSQRQPTSEPSSSSLDSLPLSERLSSLQKDCARYETIWNESATRRDVLSLAARIASDLTSSSSSSSSSSPAKRKRVRVGLCLGLGSLEGEGGGWEGRRRAWMQLFAFEGLVRGLEDGKEKKGRVRTVLQDPVFTEGDRAFLSGRGHGVLEDPGGFEVLRRGEGGMGKKEEEGEGEAKAEKEEEEEEEDGTLLFGVHLYLPVYKRALESGLPAVFVGTGWDTWDDINRGDELPALKEMHETYRREEFPEEEVLSTFSSTCVYWKGPNSRQDAGEDEARGGKSQVECPETDGEREKRSEKTPIGEHVKATI